MTISELGLDLGLISRHASISGAKVSQGGGCKITRTCTKISKYLELMYSSRPSALNQSRKYDPKCLTTNSSSFLKHIEENLIDLPVNSFRRVYPTSPLRSTKPSISYTKSARSSHPSTIPTKFSETTCNKAVKRRLDSLQSPLIRPLVLPVSTHSSSSLHDYPSQGRHGNIDSSSS